MLFKYDSRWAFLCTKVHIVCVSLTGCAGGSRAAESSDSSGPNTEASTTQPNVTESSTSEAAVTTGSVDTSTGSSTGEALPTGTTGTSMPTGTSTGAIDECDQPCGDGLACCAGACVDLQTDDEHCGACEKNCRDDGACSGAKCQPVVMAAGQITPEGLALDATSVYWTVYGSLDQGYLDGAVRQLAKSDPGGPPSNIAAKTGPGPAFIGVSGDVFWTNVAGKGGLMKNGKTCVGPLDDARSLNIDGDFVYFVNVVSLQKVNALDCTAAPGFPIATGSENYGIAVDATNIYWTDKAGAGGVWRMPKAGGLPVQIEKMGGAFELAVGEGFACFSTYETGFVYVADLQSWDAKPLAFGVPLPNALAIADGYCYWGTSGQKDDYIARRLIDMSGPEEVIVDGDLGIQAIALDEHHLYYTAEGSKSVSRIARP